MAEKERMIDKICPEGTRRRKLINVFLSGIKSLNKTNFKKLGNMIKKYGFKYTFQKLKITLAGRLKVDNRPEYIQWMENNEPKENELEKQRKTKFKFEPKISILVPMYKTPVNFFEELVDSMIRQTYSNWELCLADGSEEKNPELERIVSKDARIKYHFIGENKNISGNTNEALKLATGDYIGLLDHDDLLLDFTLFEIIKTINENPEVEFIYTDEDKIDETVENRFDPYFKPDFSIDTLRSLNYICHFSVFKKELMEKLGGFRSKYDGAQDYDIILRMSEETDKIVHISKILYHWRVHKDSTARVPEAKPYTVEAGKRALEDHFERLGLEAIVREGKARGSYEVEYKVQGNPKVSIMIPNKDGIDILKVCIKSVLEKTTYDNYEIVIIENNSTEQKTFDYYKELEKNEKIKVLNYPEKGFNYAKIMNYGAKNSDGDYLIQLNNDTELLTPDWLQKMLGFCQREDVGGVGVAMYYPDDTYQHAGTIVGLGGVAGHRFKGVPRAGHGYYSKESMIENLSAVTAACMMNPKEIYEEVGYMDEKLAVAFNDIDFCLKVREKAKKLIVYNPYVEFMHYESKTRGYEDSPEKVKRFEGEMNRFKETWEDFLEKGDPYYNKNLDLRTEQYDIRTTKVL